MKKLVYFATNSMMDEGGAARDRSRSSFLPPLFVLIGMPVLYFATVVLAIMIIRHASYMLFPSTAILLTTLLKTRSSTWPAQLLLAGIADVSANLYMGTPVFLLSVSCAANVGEALFIATMLHRFCKNEAWFASMRWMIVFTALALVAAAIGYAVVVTTVYLVAAPPLAELGRAWWQGAVTDWLSFILFAPLLLSWAEPALRAGLTGKRLVEGLALICVLLAVSYFAFNGSVPLVFLVFPFLALITVRTGLAGATAGAITVTGVATWYTLQGVGPIASMPDLAVQSRTLVLQLYFFTAILSTMPIAVTLALRAALAEKLKQQDAISNAALSNMAQGLCMFDEQDRLITCNSRYADLYFLADEFRTPGTPLSAIVEQGVLGEHPEPAQNFSPDALGRPPSSQDAAEVELPDGRIIAIQSRPLEQGGWVATHEDVTDRRLANDRIAYLAAHDPLTGLANRARFREQMQNMLAHAERGLGFALLALDLDRFKEVNDTLGHGAGDELLKQVADRLRQTVRDTDMVVRIGGDEFAVLQFPLERPEDAGTLASRLVEALGEPFDLAGQHASIGVSVGIALAPGDASEAAELLQKSDLALYRAKQDGRGTYRFFEAGMDAVQQGRRRIQSELRAAVTNGEFELYYQPILNLESERISCFEALIRWNHPTLGIVKPDDFISVAEDTGIIQPIGEWVLREACREAATWPEHVMVAVNISPAQIKNPNFASLVISAIAAAGLAPNRLELEVTESVLLKDTDAVISCLHLLRDMGVRVAMDDFGTGYSSLSYLRMFPFDRIKIDRSFVADLTGNGDSLAIVHAAVELSGRLGMMCTAEGVECPEQLAILQSEGCTHIQGYHLSRPMPASGIATLLADYPAPAEAGGRAKKAMARRR